MGDQWFASGIDNAAGRGGDLSDREAAAFANASIARASMRAADGDGIGGDGGSGHSLGSIGQVFLRQRISQWNDFLIPDGESACHYRSLQAIAEAYLGSDLTISQINGLMRSLVGSGAMSDNYYVSNPVAVVDSAFAALGRPDIAASSLGYSDASQAPPPGADASIRRVITEYAAANNGTPHSQLGNANGEFQWDPYYGGSDTTSRHLSTHYFDINDSRRLDLNGP